MRINTVSAWLRSAVSQSVGAARRVGHAVTRRIRRGTAPIDAGVGVGDDESGFRGRSRVWLELVEEYRDKLVRVFEESLFERFPRLEAMVRRVLGKPKEAPKAPALPAPARRAGPTGPLGAARPKESEESRRMKAQIQLGILRAHTQEHAGLRDAASRRLTDGAAAAEPDGAAHGPDDQT